MKTIKTFTFLLIIMAMLTTSCGQPQAPAENNAEAEVAARMTAMPGVGQKRIAISVGMDSFLFTDDAVGRTLERRLNISLTPVDIDEQDEKSLDLLASSGQLPDLLRVDVNAPYFVRWMENKVVRDLPEGRFNTHGRLKEIIENSDELDAVRRINGNKLWFIPVSGGGESDSGRIYYRKDWAEALSIAQPETVEDFMTMAGAFAQSDLTGRTDICGLTLVGGVTYLIALYGTDPESWIMENGEWIPAYYSEQMLPGLQFARELYAAGTLDYAYAVNKANTAVSRFTGGLAGSLIRHGDAYWFNRVVTETAVSAGVSPTQAVQTHVGILPPLSVAGEGNGEGENGGVNSGDEGNNGVSGGDGGNGGAGDMNGEGSGDNVSENVEAGSNTQRYWPRSVETGGCAVAATVNNEKLDRILDLLEFTLSDEGRELAYFGIRGETCAVGGDGLLKLFINPADAKPFNIVEQYPAAQFLFILDRSRYRLAEHDANIPSVLAPAVKQAGRAADALYDPWAIDEGDGFVIRFLHTPAKDAMDIDYSAAFNAIVTGSEPVDAMFAAFKSACEDKNIRAAIDEVNARMKSLKR